MSLGRAVIAALTGATVLVGGALVCTLPQVQVALSPASPGMPYPAQRTDAGTDLRWPCGAVIDVAVKPGAAAGDLDDLAHSLDKAESLTGLRFQTRSWTTGSDAPPFGSGPADGTIRVAFGPHPGTAGLSGFSDRLGNTVVLASWRALPTIPPVAQWINGADVSVATDSGRRYGGAGGLAAAIDHEIGHALGLDHARQETASVMDPVLDGSVPGFLAVDERALATLYSPCR